MIKLMLFNQSEATDEGSTASQLPLIASNVVLAILAGSDTTASVLSNIFYFLLTHPDDYNTLREEIDHAFPLDAPETPQLDVVSKLSFLNAVM